MEEDREEREEEGEEEEEGKEEENNFLEIRPMKCAGVRGGRRRMTTV